MILDFINKIENQSRSETLLVLLDFVRRLDFRDEIHRSTYDETLKRIFNKIKTAFTHKVIGEDIKFTRVRINNRPEKLYTTFNDIKYCPAENAKIGRANLEKESVLYCSNDPGTSVFEVRPKLGDWITTTEFKYKNSNLSSLVLGGKVSLSQKFNSLPPFQQGLHDFFEIIFTEQIDEDLSYNYYKTAIVCKRLLSITGSIVYPSVASNLKGWNYVFTTNEFYRNLSFLNSRTQEIIDYKSESEMIAKCLFVAESLDSRGGLEWQNHTPDCPGHEINEMIYDHRNL